MEDTEKYQKQSRLTPVLKLSEMERSSGGIIHDLVNHVTTATLSMNHMERRLNRDSNLLRQYAKQSARTRRSIERFAVSARSYIRNEKGSQKINLKKEIDSILESFKLNADKNGVKILIKGSGKIHIVGNQFKFSQILSNLISNSLYALEQKGKENGDLKKKIGVSFHKNNDSVIITTEDNGTGIPPKIQDRIFDPFFTTKNNRGSGIGLFSIKKIIENDFGGKIKFIPKNGAESGAIFVVSINKT